MEKKKETWLEMARRHDRERLSWRVTHEHGLLVDDSCLEVGENRTRIEALEDRFRTHEVWHADSKCNWGALYEALDVLSKRVDALAASLAQHKTESGWKED